MSDSLNGNQLFLASGGYDHCIKLWNVQTVLCYHTLQFSDSQVNQLSVSSNRQILAAAGYRTVRLYDLNSNHINPIYNCESIAKNITNVGFAENNKWMYTAGEDCNVRVWDLRHRVPQCQRLFQAASPINCAILHPNQRELIVGDQNGSIFLWDIKGEHYEQLTTENEVPILSVDINNEGTMLAAVNNKGCCYIWSLNYSVIVDNYESNKIVPRYKFVAHQKYVLKCKFSPNSKYLATASADQSTKIWQLKDFSLFREFKHENQKWVWDVAFGADSKYIFTASSDGNVKLWNIENGFKERTYVGHQKAVISIAFRDVIL